MKKITKIIYITAFYMFLSEIRPLNPYMSAYLTGPDGNVSLTEVAGVFELIKIISAIIIEILMLITADYLLYKPNIVFLTFWASISYLLMTASPSLMRLRVSMFGIGAMSNSNALAFSYLYAQIEDVGQFQMATSINVASVQLGKLAGNVLAQVIVYTTSSYTSLPYMTALALLLATVWANSFPPVKRKKHFLKAIVPQNEKTRLLEISDIVVKPSYKQQYGEIEPNTNVNGTAVSVILKETWVNFKTSYSNPMVLKWCLWLVFEMTSYIEVLVNINVLYSYVVEKSSTQNIFANGIAEALVTLSGAIGSYLVGKLQLDWTRYGDLFMAFCSTLMGLLMISCYFFQQIFIIYVLHILHSLVCQMLFVIIFTEIAKHLKKKCYTLVLEISYMGSSILALIITLFLTQYNYTNITIPGRFLVIGGCYIILAITSALNSIFELEKKKIFY